MGGRWGVPSTASTASTSTPSKPRTSVLKPHPRLLIKPLYEDLRKVAKASGQGSQKTRQAIVERLVLCAVGAGWTSGMEKGKGKQRGDALSRRAALPHRETPAGRSLSERAGDEFDN